MATINIGEIAATTLRNRSGKLADNVSNHNALWMRLNKKGNIRPLDGGRDIVQELEYAENGTVAWYSGYETLSTTPTDVFDAATFDWKQLAGTVTISGLEEIKNSGKEAIINLIDSRLKNLERSLINTASTAVYADGTGSGGKELGGLQLIIDDDPSSSSTVGGINSVTYSFWRNQYSAAATTTSTNILARMNSMWLSCLRGKDKPDFIATGSSMYSKFEAALQQYQRFTDASMAEAGFEALKYKTADVIYDDQATANRMYFVNTDYLFLRPHKDRQFVPLEDRMAINQDAYVIPVVWAGNMTCSNRSLQGVIIQS
jgi:hypothetical protein